MTRFKSILTLLGLSATLALSGACDEASGRTWEPIQSEVVEAIMLRSGQRATLSASALVDAICRREAWLVAGEGGSQQPIPGAPTGWSWEADWKLFINGLGQLDGEAKEQLLAAPAAACPASQRLIRQRANELIMLALAPASVDPKVKVDLQAACASVLRRGASREIAVYCLGIMDATSLLATLPAWLPMVQSRWYVDLSKSNPPLSATRVVRTYPARSAAAAALTSLGVKTVSKRVGEERAGTSYDDLRMLEISYEEADLAEALCAHATGGTDEEAKSAALAAVALGPQFVRSLEACLGRLTGQRAELLRLALSKERSDESRD